MEEILKTIALHIDKFDVAKHSAPTKAVSFCIPPLETLKFLLLIESEDAGFLEGSLQFAEAAELLLAAAGC